MGIQFRNYSSDGYAFGFDLAPQTGVRAMTNLNMAAAE